MLVFLQIPGWLITKKTFAHMTLMHQRAILIPFKNVKPHYKDNLWATLKLLIVTFQQTRARNQLNHMKTTCEQSFVIYKRKKTIKAVFHFRLVRSMRLVAALIHQFAFKTFPGVFQMTKSIPQSKSYTRRTVFTISLAETRKSWHFESP